jgi:hypothetical protein
MPMSGPYHVRHLVCRGDVSMRTDSEFPGYWRGLATKEDGDRACFLWPDLVSAGDDHVLVPLDCEEAKKMLADEQYSGAPAHYVCVMRVLG